MTRNILFFLALVTSSILHGQLVIDFESDTTGYSIMGNQAAVVDNPDQVGNSSTKCAYYRKMEGNWHPFIVLFPDTLNTGHYDRISFKVRTSTSGRIYIKFWNGQEVLKESWVREYNYRPSPNEWTELVYDISDILNQDLTMIEITASVDNTDPADIYYDDIQLYHSSSTQEGDLMAMFNLSKSRVPLNESIQLDATLSTDFDKDKISIEWNLGDGSVVNDQISFTHTYEFPGIFQVTLQLTDSLGTSVNTTQTVWVYHQEETISPFFENMGTYPTNEKVELSFWTVKEAENPYDPEEMELDALITLPDGRTIKVPCFYYVASFYEDNNWMVDENKNCWMLRFSSDLPGTCSINIQQKTVDGLKESTIRTVSIIPGTEKGIIRQDPNNQQYYRHSTGEPYYPLGINVAWDNIDNYGLVAENLGMGQANFIRYWHAAFTNQALEWNRFGLGHYNPIAAAKQDSLIDLCRIHNLYLQMCIFHHGMFSHTVNSNWGQNPYRDINGGMLSDGEQFFYNEEAKSSTKKLLRYIVARWGYSSHLFAWELFNEVQWTGNYPSQSDQWAPAVITWHDEMSQYIQSLDAFDHLVTTSADDQQLIAMDRINSIDILQYHVYPNQKIVNTLVNKDRQFLKATNKSSILCGEYGYAGDVDVPFEEQRLAIWTGLFAGVPHMIWRKEVHYQPVWTDLFIEPSLFFADEDLVQNGTITEWIFESNKGLQTLGLKASNDFYFGLLYDQSLKDSIQAIAKLDQVNYGIYSFEGVDIGSQHEVTTIKEFRIAPKAQQIDLPNFSHGLAFKLKFVEPLDELIAYAGEDATIGLGQSFDLQSSQSVIPPNNVNPSVEWQILQQPDSSAFLLADPFGTNVNILPDVVGDYSFELTLSLPEGTVSRDTLGIYVSAPPIAVAGDDQQITLGERATFSGRNSFDPENDPITYQWNLIRHPEGSLAELNFAGTAVPNIKPDLVGTYALELLVNDGYTFGNPDTVMVVVEEVLVSTTNTISATELKVYPNPTADWLYIDAVDNQMSIINLTIHSIEGRQIWQAKPEDIKPQSVKVQLKQIGLAEGIYHLHILTNKGIITRSFTIY